MAEKVPTQEDFTTARYSPPTAGLHQLRVQEGGTDTPLNVEVMPRRAGQIFTDLMKPTELAITRLLGHLLWQNVANTVSPTN